MRPLTSIALAVVLALLACASAEADDCHLNEDRFGPWTPDYAKVQSGGYVGALTLGVGYLFFDQRLDLATLYGFVPGALGGTTHHILALAARGRVPGLCLTRELNWVYVYGGAGVLFTFGDGFFVRVPERYHDPRYYRATASRWTFTLGSELALRQRTKGGAIAHALYWEVSALDVYIAIWLRNPGSVSFVSMFSSSVGYRLQF